MKREWDTSEEIRAYNKMTKDEKRRDLFARQKKTLDLFLEHGAISRAQYDQSLGDMKVKMGLSAF